MADVLEERLVDEEEALSRDACCGVLWRRSQS